MLNVQEVLWYDVRDEVNKINSSLANICDMITPDRKFPLYRIKYSYGAKIVDNGCFNLPLLNGQIVHLNDARVPDNLKEQLSYCHIPLSLILSNDVEVFIDTKNRTIPLNFFKAGELFGVFESVATLVGTTLQPRWSVTAGARSVFMLPKISDKVGHGRLKKELGISCEAPNNLREQWHVFTQIANSGNMQDNWYNEILVFGKTWFDSECKDFNWFKFQQYLFKINWIQSKLLMDTAEFGMIWEDFSETIAKHGFKPRMYIIDTIKYLTTVVAGSGVAFIPSTNESSAPISLIQQVYIEVYGLKNYIPTIMQSAKLNHSVKLYYSLAYPTTLESSPITRSVPSIIDDQRQVRLLLNLLMQRVGDSNKYVKNNIKYAFFHSDFDKYGEIADSGLLPLHDDRFNFSLFETQNNIFCNTATFFRGCITLTQSE